MEKVIAPKEDEVILIKSMTGLDYIGKLANETETSYTIKAMLAVMPQDTQAGDIHIGLGAPMHPALGKFDPKSHHGALDVEMPKTSVVFTCEANEQLLDIYTNAMSGIQIVHKLPGNL